MSSWGVGQQASGSVALPHPQPHAPSPPHPAEQLHPAAFEEAARGKLHLISRMQEGYDHSYFTIATFIDDHVAFHAKHLLGGGGDGGSS